MAQVRDKYPSPVWDLDERIDEFLADLGFRIELKKFFNLMSQTDLDQIRDCGERVWGLDEDAAGTVANALDVVSTELPHIRDMVGEKWRDSEAFNRFSRWMETDSSFFEKSADVALKVGDTLAEFAEACETTIADNIAWITGIVGAVVGFLVGLPFGGPLTGASELAGLIGAIIGFAIGLVVTYVGIVLPKAATAVGELNDLADQRPPGIDR